jgi:hypothetical protein
LVSDRIAASDDHAWRKPVANRNQYPPSLLVLALEPEHGTVLGRGESFFFRLRLLERHPGGEG